MQRKHLLALAVASAFAVPGAAFAQVTISGAFRYSVDAVDFGSGQGATAAAIAANAGSGVNKWGMSSHSSNIKFTSRESLGGGLTAWGVLENGFTTGRTNAQNFGFFGRNSAVGIDSTSWGTVLAGLWDSPYKQVDGAWSIGTPAGYSYAATAPIFGNGDSTGSMPNPNCSVNESGAGYTIAAVPATVCAFSAGSKTAFQRRLSNVVQWFSPTWNGLQLNVAVETNGPKTSSTFANVGGTISRADPSLWAMHVRYTQPNWAVVVAYENHKNFNLSAQTATAATDSRNSSDNAWKLGGNYNFGVVQIGAAYEELKYDLGTNGTPTNRKDKNWSLQAAMPFGPHTVRGAYTNGSVSGTVVAAGTSQDATLWTLSYEYALSKRSLLYVAYAKLNQDNASTRNFGTNIEAHNGATQGILTGADVRYISFGMNHNF